MFSQNAVIATFQAARIAEESWRDIETELIDEERIREYIETIANLEANQSFVDDLGD
jgi:hypothetical protein